MLKTKKQIAEAVIKDYKSLIKKADKLNYREFRHLLMTEYAHSGVCIYVENKYEKDIANRRYVQKHFKYSSRGQKEDYASYWWKIPYYARTKKETIECLQKRIDILKTWL